MQRLNVAYGSALPAWKYHLFIQIVGQFNFFPEHPEEKSDVRGSKGADEKSLSLIGFLWNCLWMTTSPAQTDDVDAEVHAFQAHLLLSIQLLETCMPNLRPLQSPRQRAAGESVCKLSDILIDAKTFPFMLLIGVGMFWRRVGCRRLFYRPLSVGVRCHGRLFETTHLSWISLNFQ